MKPIVKVNYGIASSYNDFIEINHKLKGSLKRKIIAHEKRHTSGKYSKADYQNDYHSSDPYFFESLWFAIKNPEALINFFPLMYSYYGRFWTYNTSSLLPLAQYGVIWTTFFWLLFNINPFLGFLGYIITSLGINLILLIYTHIYVKINH